MHTSPNTHFSFTLTGPYFIELMVQSPSRGAAEIA